MEWIILLWYTLVGIGSLLIGYGLGARRSRHKKKQALRDLNTRSLELLDARQSLQKLENYAAQKHRQERLQALSLKRLQQANQQSRELSLQLESQNKRHYIEQSRMRLQLVESQELASKAARVARSVTAHLKRLELASPATQTIEAHEPKSYGNSEAVTVSVVDQARPDSLNGSVAPVTNRDSARLSKLHSSNEATAPSI